MASHVRLNSGRFGAPELTLIAIGLWFGLPGSFLCAQTDVPSAQAVRRTLVVLIGGMDSDPTPSQIAGKAGRGGNSGLYRLMGDLRHAQIDTEYFNWNGTRAGQIKSKPQADVTEIVATIRDHVTRRRGCRVVVVGNSWGGHTAWDVCRTLVESPQPIAIDYAIFLDPSSTGRADAARPKQLPININRATNIYTRNLFGWRKWPNEPRIDNIDLGDAKGGYLRQGGPAYNSAFDFQAHVAAEWDEKIHAMMKQRIFNRVEGRPLVATADAMSPAPQVVPATEKASKSVP